MDFTTDETTAELTRLARSIVTKLSTPERVAELESANAPIDTALWQALGAAGLIGLELPADLAGVGGGQSAVDTLSLIHISEPTRPY